MCLSQYVLLCPILLFPIENKSRICDISNSLQLKISSFRISNGYCNESAFSTFPKTLIQNLQRERGWWTEYAELCVRAVLEAQPRLL